MIGLGTLVNTAAILAGGLIGLFAGKLLSDQMQSSLLKANGLCVLFIGLSGALAGFEGGQKDLMVIISFAAGTLTGEWIGIEQKLEQFGNWLKEISGSKNEAGFIHGFVTTSLTVCIGAMAIVGSIQDGIFRDPSILYAKAILDFIIVMVLTSSLGKGCLFSAVPVFLLQMSVTLLSFQVSGWFTQPVLENISMTGSMMIFCVGLNLMFKEKIKVANMLPALILAALSAIWY